MHHSTPTHVHAATPAYGVGRSMAHVKHHTCCSTRFFSVTCTARGAHALALLAALAEEIVFFVLQAEMINNERFKSRTTNTMVA